MKTDDFTTTKVMETNSGKFHDLAISPITNVAVSVGADGYARVWDYGNRR